MKEILEAHGFKYTGNCFVCGGNAFIYEKGKNLCKIYPRKNTFALIVNNIKIVGKSEILEATLKKYIPS